jgi:hypothetical protein
MLANLAVSSAAEQAASAWQTLCDSDSRCLTIATMPVQLGQRREYIDTLLPLVKVSSCRTTATMTAVESITRFHKPPHSIVPVLSMPG